MCFWNLKKNIKYVFSNTYFECQDEQSPSHWRRTEFQAGASCFYPHRSVVSCWCKWSLSWAEAAWYRSRNHGRPCSSCESLLASLHDVFAKVLSTSDDVLPPPPKASMSATHLSFPCTWIINEWMDEWVNQSMSITPITIIKSQVKYRNY